MFYTLILENETGQQIDLSKTANRYMFFKIKGLDPPTGTVSTSNYAGMNGSYLNNAFIEKRNVVIPFEMRGFDVEKRRHELYQVVKPSRYIKIYYSTKNISVYAEGTVETCEVENFEKLTNGQISGDIQKGDIITTTTKTGNKTVTLEREGVVTNIINRLVSGSTWLNLKAGENKFYVRASDGLNNIKVRLIHRNAYLGV